MASLTTMPRRSLRPGTFSGALRSALALVLAAGFFVAAFLAAAFFAAGLRAADCLAAGLPLSVFFVVAIRLHHRLPCEHARVPPAWSAGERSRGASRSTCAGCRAARWRAGSAG